MGVHGALGAALLCQVAVGAAVIGAEPQPATGGGTTFFTIGDWGSGYGYQTSVAVTMGEWADRLKPSFILSAGDNVYEDGVSSVTDVLWEERYERVYNATGLDIPWFAILGNHDYHQNEKAQIEYATQSPRWILDDYYYTRTVQVEGNRTLQVVLLDTISLAYNTHVREVEKQHAEGTLSAEVLNRTLGLVPELKNRRVTQLRWLEDTLAASKADWLVVAGHFPVLSGGEHGDTSELKDDIKPLLERYDVDCYVSGHDHTLQALFSDRVWYLVSGGGGKVGTYAPVKQSAFGTVDPGFMVHTVQGDVMTVTIVDSKGRERYKLELVQKRNRATAGAVVGKAS